MRTQLRPPVMGRAKRELVTNMMSLYIYFRFHVYLCGLFLPCCCCSLLRLQDYCAKGDLDKMLFRYAAHYQETLPLEMRNAICQQISHGIERMHADRIIHCDLKPEHVFFDFRSARCSISND